MASNSPTPPLTRSRDGVFLGVCRGIAEHKKIPVFWIRTAMIATMFVTGFWPIFIAYFLAAFLMKPQPDHSDAIQDPDADFDLVLSVSREEAIQRIETLQRSIDARLQRLETHVTSLDYKRKKQ